MSIVPLSECDDRRLWRAGIVSLFSLATQGPVLTDYGTLVQCTGSRGLDGERPTYHEWGAGIEEDGERYRMCERCQLVEVHPFVLIDDMEVSRHPQGEPREAMPVAWDAVPRFVLEGPR